MEIEKFGKILLITVIIIFLCVASLVIGYQGGINRAVKSAELVSYSEDGYEISYDLAGTHYYN